MPPQIGRFRWVSRTYFEVLTYCVGERRHPARVPRRRRAAAAAPHQNAVELCFVPSFTFRKLRFGGAAVAELETVTQAK